MNSRRVSARFIAMLALTALAVQGCSKEGAVAGGVALFGIVLVQERSVGDAFSDTVIYATVAELLIRHHIELYRDVNIEVVEGRVLLAGSVRRPEDRVEAVRLAWRAAGVEAVINEIEITGRLGIGNRARDTWINAQLLAKLLVDKDIRALNYNVETVNGVVYLIGVALSAAELVRATNHARAIPHVRKVVSHVRLAAAPLG